MSPNDTEYSVIIDTVSKIYRAETTQKTQQHTLHPLKRAFHTLTGYPRRSTIHALHDISLAVQTGEAVGILGVNGSGKSTLLRLIAGVEPPTQGRILARTQPSLLGIGSALVPHRTGLQNITLGCLAMGLTPQETADITPTIVDIAGIGDAIYRPMKTYSAGMGARLRFAINAASRPEILLIDEALGAGDATFQEKSEKILDDILNQAGTVFMVSHAAQTIENMCTRAIWLHEGRIIADGPAQQTAQRYRLWAWRVAHGEHEKAHTMLHDTINSYQPTRIYYQTNRTRSNHRPQHAQKR